MKAVRYFSIMNPWIDVIIFVPDDKVEATKTAINLSMDAYFDPELYGTCDIGYVDCIEMYLKDQGVTDFKILFYDEEESNKYENYDIIWENICSKIDGLITVA